MKDIGIHTILLEGEGEILVTRDNQWGSNSAYLISKKKAGDEYTALRRDYREHSQNHLGDASQTILDGGDRRFAWSIKHNDHNNTFGFQNESSGRWLGVNEAGDITATASQWLDWQTFKFKPSGFPGWISMWMSFKGHNLAVVKAESPAANGLNHLKLAPHSSVPGNLFMFGEPLFVSSVRNLLS